MRLSALVRAAEAGREPRRPAAGKHGRVPRQLWPSDDGARRGRWIASAAAAGAGKTARQSFRAWDWFGSTSANRKITIECWPFLADVTQPGNAIPRLAVKRSICRPIMAAKPRRSCRGSKFKASSDPVVEVIDERSGELVYVLRLRGNSWQPHAFAAGQIHACGSACRRRERPRSSKGWKPRWIIRPSSMWSCDTLARSASEGSVRSIRSRSEPALAYS